MVIAARRRLAALEREFRDVQDRLAIKETLLRYARGVDNRDFAAVRACFIKEAVVDGSLGNTTIEEYCESLRVELAAYQGTMHFIGNQYVEVGGDQATLSSYAVAYHCVGREPSERDLIVGVRYLDEFRRSEDTWLIERRKVQPVFVGARFVPRQGGGARFADE